MTALLHDLIDLYIFPRGRREFALRAMAALAQDQGHADLAAHCDQAAEHDRRTRELERASESAQARGADPELAGLDARMDRTLSALASVPEATARARRPDHAGGWRLP